MPTPEELATARKIRRDRMRHALDVADRNDLDVCLLDPEKLHLFGQPLIATSRRVTSSSTDRRGTIRHLWGQIEDVAVTWCESEAAQAVTA